MSPYVNFWQRINALGKRTNAWFSDPRGEGKKKNTQHLKTHQKWRDEIQFQTKNTHYLSLSRRRSGEGH